MRDATWIVLVLVAALAHASWNALIKSGSDRTASLWIMLATGGVVGLAMVPWVGGIGARAWFHIGVTTVLQSVYCVFLLRAYARGDLSHVYPIARGLGPVLVALTSFVAHESLGAVEWLGLGLVACGLGVLARPRAAAGASSGQATLYAIGTGVLIASYTMNDALGTRAATSGIAYVAWLQVVAPIPFTIYLLVRHGSGFSTMDRRQILRGIGGGLLSCASYSIALLALRVGKVAHVAALRETSVVFAAIIGAYLLKERVGAIRAGAAALVAAGLVVMHVGAG